MPTSSDTPGDIVAATVTPWMNTPLAVAGFARTTESIAASVFSTRANIGSADARGNLTVAALKALVFQGFR